MIRASDVTSGTPSTRAVATMIRSAGSQSRVEPGAITSLATAGVTGWTSTRGAAVAGASHSSTGSESRTRAASTSDAISHNEMSATRMDDQVRFWRAYVSGHASGAGNGRTTTARCVYRAGRASARSATRLSSAPCARRITVVPGPQQSAGGIPCGRRDHWRDPVAERLDRVPQGILGGARPAVVGGREAGERLPALGDQQGLARPGDFFQQRETPRLEGRDRHRLHGHFS